MPENLSKLHPSLPMKNENISNNSSTPTGTSTFDNSESFGEAIQVSERKKKVTLTKYHIFQLLTTNSLSQNSVNAASEPNPDQLDSISCHETSHICSRILQNIPDNLDRNSFVIFPLIFTSFTAIYLLHFQ